MGLTLILTYITQAWAYIATNCRTQTKASKDRLFQEKVALHAAVLVTFITAVQIMVSTGMCLLTLMGATLVAIRTLVIPSRGIQNIVTVITLIMGANFLQALAATTATLSFRTQDISQLLN